MGCSLIVIYWLAPPLPFLFVIYFIPIVDLDQYCVCDANTFFLMKQTVFAFKTAKTLISDYFGVVYRIIDPEVLCDV